MCIKLIKKSRKSTQTQLDLVQAYKVPNWE